MDGLRYLVSHHQPQTLTVVEHTTTTKANPGHGPGPIIRHMTYREAAHELRAEKHPRHKSVWLLVDAHNLDDALAEFMALYKQMLSPDPLHHVVFDAFVPVDAAQQWAAYLHVAPEALAIPLTSHTPLIDVQHSPTMTQPLDIAQWIAGRMDLQGDVLIFTSSMSACRRLVRMLRDHRFFLQHPVPVIAITKHAPTPATHASGSNKPRILVGTPLLDKLLHRTFTRNVQHVIDCGKVRGPRLAHDVWITQNVAFRRMRAASRKAPGVCLKLYPEDAPLSTDPVATHYLDTEIAQASITVACGGPAMLQGMPGIGHPLLPLESMDILQTMTVLRVGRAAARCIHGLPPDVGITVAAILECHDGPCPRQNLEAARQGKVPTAVYKRIQAWTAKLGRRLLLSSPTAPSPPPDDTVPAALRRTTWAAVRSVLLMAYAHQTAVRTDIHQWYVDVATGRLLTCAPSVSDAPAVVYTAVAGDANAHATTTSACAIRQCIPTADDAANVTVRLRRQTLTSPVKFVHDLQIKATEHFFASRGVAAAVRSPTTVDVAYLETHDRQAQVEEWQALALQMAHARPIRVHISDHMALLLTAGLQVSDAVLRTDFIVLECPDTPSPACMERIARLQGAWTPDGRILLPSRLAMQNAWNTVDPVVGKTFVALDRDAHGMYPSHRVVSRFVVRVYHGKSTGRATVTPPLHKWQQHLPPSWTYDPTTQLLRGIPRAWDELDVARKLQLTWHDVKIERRHLVVRQVPAIRKLLRKLRQLYPAPGSLTCTRKAHYTEYGVDIDPAHRHIILTSVLQGLPASHRAVNQPLRTFWRVHVLAEPHQPRSMPQPRFHFDVDVHSRSTDIEFEITRPHSPHAGDLLLLAVDIAQEQARAMTPTILWLPALAYATWVPTPWPPTLVERDGPRFVVYGPPATKSSLTRQLQTLAEHLPPPPHPLPTCPICWENTAYFTLQGCGCTYCVDCIATAFAIKCEDVAWVGQLQCPRCRDPVVTEDLEKLVRPEHLSRVALRLAGFLSKRQPTMVRECPAGCRAFGRAKIDGVFACATCAKEWCCACSDADPENRPVEKHVGYCLSRLPHSDAWKAFHKEATDAGAKACPVCKTLVVKDGGCNHVACPAPRCHTHFCWKCTHAFSSQQGSPMAQGVIEDVHPVSGDVLVRVDPDTWHTPCLTPCPPFVRCRRSLANTLLLEEGNTCQKGARVWVYTYIYDHIDACANGP